MVYLEKVTKSFSGKKAVQQISLGAKEGEILGLVGTNGSGKTTTLKMIVGLLQPDEGRIEVNGIDRLQEPVRARHFMGYAPEAPYLYDYLSGADYLRFVGQARGLAEAEARQTAQSLLKFFDLLSAKDDLMRHYSYGMKKKISVASAFVGSPRVLILDEPTEGLDIFAVARLSEKLQGLRAQDKTILVASHTTPFLAEICDRLVILHNGRLMGSVEMSGFSAEERQIRLEQTYAHFVQGEKRK